MTYQNPYTLLKNDEFTEISNIKYTASAVSHCGIFEENPYIPLTNDTILIEAEKDPCKSINSVIHDIVSIYYKTHRLQYLHVEGSCCLATKSKETHVLPLNITIFDAAGLNIPALIGMQMHKDTPWYL